MAETSKVNHDHTYDILTSLKNINPSLPEDNDVLFGITSPQPSDTSSDSGLALSPLQFEGFDMNLADDTSLDNFDLDFDLSFLDGLDSKILNNYQEPSDKSVPLASTVTPELTSLAETMDDAEASDKISNAAQPIVSSVSTSSSKTLPSLQVMTNSANVTPVVISEIRPVMKIATKTSGKDKLVITEEERKLLEEEGHVLPTNVALTKEEEKILKKVRRKIKNKVSAQESRRKKKEYIDGLELRVKSCTDQNHILQKKVESLEEQNRTLLEELKTLQELVATSNRSKKQASTCLLVLVLAFALVAFPFKNAFPFDASGSSLAGNAVADSYTTMPVRSRTLLQFDEESETSSAINISHYLRAFSVVFSFAKDKPEMGSYSKPSPIAFDDGRSTNEDGVTNEYSFSK